MKEAIRALKLFRDERDWAQFHDPKNLAAALGIEAAELNEGARTFKLPFQHRR